MDDDFKWLRDCGWVGWTVDVFTGAVETHHGNTFRDIGALRRWLECLPTWPRARDGARNIPAAPQPPAREAVDE